MSKEKKNNTHNEKELNPEESNNKINRDAPSPDTPDTGNVQSGAADETIESLHQTIETLKSEVESFRDKYLRKAAEFENYKKRTEQEFLNSRLYANEKLIADLLPVLDDFERSLRVSKERREFGPFYKGVELIYQKFIKLLESKGLKRIDALGQDFNVDLHDALMQVPKEDVQPNVVVEEVEKGYALNDRIIRHAKVIVSTKPDSSEQDNTTVQEKKEENK